jgi:DNA-binding beta-propeller fold protein YncE
VKLSRTRNRIVFEYPADHTWIVDDGLAYSPATKRVFVSDEHGGVDAVVDTVSAQLLTDIPLGGGAANTVYDSASEHILVAVHSVLGILDG